MMLVPPVIFSRVWYFYEIFYKDNKNTSLVQSDKQLSRQQINVSLIYICAFRESTYTTREQCNHDNYQYT